MRHALSLLLGLRRNPYRPMIYVKYIYHGTILHPFCRAVNRSSGGDTGNQTRPTMPKPDFGLCAEISSASGPVERRGVACIIRVYGIPGTSLPRAARHLPPPAIRARGAAGRAADRQYRAAIAEPADPARLY